MKQSFAHTQASAAKPGEMVWFVQVFYGNGNRKLVVRDKSGVTVEVEMPAVEFAHMIEAMRGS